MKSKDQLLLEQAYQQVQEGLWDKAKSGVNKLVQFNPNAPGGKEYEANKAAADQKTIQNIVAQLSDGTKEPPYVTPKSIVPEVQKYIDYIRNNVKISPEVAKELEDLDSNLVNGLIQAYDVRKMQIRDEKPFVDPEEQDARERSAALADQQKFAAQRRQAQGY
jgi:hypothetical protein